MLNQIRSAQDDAREYPEIYLGFLAQSPSLVAAGWSRDSLVFENCLTIVNDQAGVILSQQRLLESFVESI